MKLSRLTCSGLLLAMLGATITLGAQISANDYTRLGSPERKKGNLETAIADFTKAIELSLDYAVAYSNRDSAKRDFDGAIDDFTKAVDLDPNHLIGATNLGSAEKRKTRSSAPRTPGGNGRSTPWPWRESNSAAPACAPSVGHF